MNPLGKEILSKLNALDNKVERLISMLDGDNFLNESVDVEQPSITEPVNNQPIVIQKMEGVEATFIDHTKVRG